MYVSLESPYMTLLNDHLAKKHRLAIDAWGADDTAVRHIYQPVVDHIAQEVPQRFLDLYPAPVWKLDSRVARISRNILMSEFLIREWAEHFVGKSEEELDNIAASFKFDKCVKRERLNAVLMENAKLVEDHVSNIQAA